MVHLWLKKNTEEEGDWMFYMNLLDSGWCFQTCFIVLRFYPSFEQIRLRWILNIAPMGSSHEQAGNLQHEPLRLVGDISDDWIWSFSILVGWHQARSAETTFCLSQNKAPFFAGEQGSRWTSLLWKSRCQRCPHIPFHDLAIPIFSSAGWPISTEVFKSWLFRMPVWLKVSYDLNHLTDWTTGCWFLGTRQWLNTF